MKGCDDYVFEMLDAYLSQLHFLNYIFFSITKMVWWRQTISNLEHLDCLSLSSFSYIKKVSHYLFLQKRIANTLIMEPKTVPNINATASGNGWNL